MVAPSLDRILDAILRIDGKGSVQFISESGLAWFGGEGVGPAPGANFLEWLTPADAAALNALLAKHSESFELDVSLRKGAGAEHVHLRGFRLPDARQFTLCLLDTSRWRGEHMSLRHAVLHDDLTGLPNRTALKELLEERITRQAPFSLALLDLDGFKQVNDSFGHACGDEVLCETSRRLRSSVADGQVFRLGGDEFVFVHIDTNCETAAKLLDAVLMNLARPFRIGPQTAYLGGSIGVAEFPVHGDNYSEILKNADTAMYHAKNTGKQRISIFTEPLDSIDFSLKAAIHQGIENGEFFMHFQPQFDTQGKLTGAEALMRWQSTAFGMVSPDRFIPVVESAGLMPYLGDWALRYACHQLKAIAALMPEFVMSVNVSPLQLMQDEFANKVMHAVAEAGIGERQLHLEITESTLMRNPEHVETEMNQLRKAGIRFEIDDFGTGYSSLSALTRLPVDVLKIDRSFITPLDDERNRIPAQKVIQAIMSLATGLSLKVIAEGVETERQLNDLRQAGCHYIQGYLFGKPMTGDQLLALVRQSRAGGGLT